LIYANATAVANDIMMRAEANATLLEYEGYATAYRTLMNSVTTMSDDTALLSFMFSESISKYQKNSNLNVGFTKPNVLVTNGKP
jgi:hypothetical protein